MAAAAHQMAGSDVSSVEEGWRGSRVGGDPESTASEEECDLMVEALRRELEEIKVGAKPTARCRACGTAN